jgi:hypothetical protein
MDTRFPFLHRAEADGCNAHTGTPADQKASTTMRFNLAAMVATSAKPRHSTSLCTPCRVP